MKTILVPTDYSETANNAVNFAAELARITKAKIVLLHAYHLPAQVGEVPFVPVSETELQQSSMKGLTKLQKKLAAKHKGVKIECVTRAGFAVDVIREFAKELNTDMIVMGISGAGALGEAVLGSIAVDTIREAGCPVLIIPGSAKFTVPSKIVYATDYSDIRDAGAFSILLELNKLFRSKLLLVNVISETETATFRKAIAGVRLENILQSVPHSLHFPVNDSVVDGVNEFVDETGAGMIAMVAHKHNVFYRMFNLSSTKRMAFHTKVPLLAIPDTSRSKEKAAVPRKRRTAGNLIQ